VAPNYCVYIVDDDEDDTYFIQQALLENCSACEVLTFANGAELIDCIDKPHPTKWPCLIILDLNMPVMDGFETLTYLKQNPRYGTIPVVVMTTSSADADVVRSYNLGSNSFIVKPADFSRLKEITGHLIDYWFRTTTLPSLLALQE
jgi:CheY-like chemotaxis protein